MSVRKEHGLACPRCDSDEWLRIEAQAILAPIPDGTTEIVNEERVWDGDSFCMCSNCEYEGQVADFEVAP